MTAFQIIHLTDLHYRGLAEDNRRLERLISDINSRSRAHPTVLCFTGDLTNTGSQEEYESLLENFFSKLPAELRVYTCPGNHDVQRGRTSKEIAEAAEAARRLEIVSGGEQTSPFDGSCPLEQYHSIQQAVSEFEKNGYFTSFGETESLNIVSINTAWLSRQRDKDTTDKGHLKVDEASLDKTIKLLSPGKLNLLMMHHPISWLDHQSQIYIREVIANHFEVVLFGHEHEADASHLTSNKGGAVFIQSTAAQAGWSHGLNGYSAVKVDSKSRAIQIRFRSYSPARAEFIDGTDIVDTGYHYPRDSDKAFWVKELSENPSHLLNRAIAAAASADYRDIFSKNFPSKIKLDHDPIAPMFRAVRFTDGERSATPRLKIGTCLASMDRIAIFGGPRDSGLTTSCYISYREICEDVTKFDAIPIYINLEEVTVNRASFLREVQRGAVADYTHREAEILCRTGKVFFLFDSVCIQQSETFARLYQVLGDHFPDCRAAIFCSLDKRSVDLDHEGRVGLDPVKDSIFEICELTASEIREVIERKASKESPQVREGMLNNAVICFKAMDEPIFPTTVSILIDTLKQLPDFKPINRVRLLDRYIECLLGRYTLDDVRVGHFNSSEKSNLLSYIAGEMVSNGTVSLTRSEIFDIVSKYQEDMLLEIPKGAISDFVDKGILFAQGERFTFRADYLFSYFVAKEMVRNEDLFNEVTSGEKFFSYHNEIVYYGELEGVDNSQLLARAHDYIEDIEGVILSQYEAHGVDFRAEWEAMTKDVAGDTGVLAETIEAIASEVPTEVSREKSREQDLEFHPRSRGVGSRATIKELEAKWLITLRTYMQLMKHSSSLPGAKKISHLNKILASLERFAQNIAVKREMISSQPMYYHGGILYINQLAATDLEKSKREFKYAAPLSISKMASDLLSSVQLNLALQRLAGSSGEFSDFIIRGLLLDMPSDKSMEIISSGIVDCKNQTLQIAGLRSLKSKYLSYKSDDAEVVFCREIIDNLGKRRSLQGKINRNVLEKQRMLRTMKEKNETKSSE